MFNENSAEKDSDSSNRTLTSNTSLAGMSARIYKVFTKVNCS